MLEIPCYMDEKYSLENIKLDKQVTFSRVIGKIYIDYVKNWLGT